MEDLTTKIRTDSWDKALDSFGYSYIYSKRIRRIDNILKWTKVLGVLLPVLLGGITAAYYTNADVMKIALLFITPLAIAQLALSTILIVLGSDGQLSNYSRKSTEFSLLSSEFEQLAKFPDNDFNVLSKKYDILVERERNLSRDNFEIKDEENRIGMRAGLRNYRRECAGCKETPISMKPTKCDVCGNF